MKEYIKIIEKSKLFSGIFGSEIESVIKCLSASILKYKKGEYVFRYGDSISSVGLLLEGKMHITKDNYWGDRIILAEITEGMLFGEAYACSGCAGLSVNAVAAQDSVIMLLDVKKIIKTCPSSCTFHNKLIQNLITVLADKNILLTDKIEHMAQKKLKDKLLSYLYEYSKKEGSFKFEIPFNRQELADYLSVDRSALSSELCKLRDDGVLKFNKNHFELIK